MATSRSWARVISVIALLTVLVGTAPAEAAIKIKRIHFDPPGEDTGTNSHLNREYIYLVNAGDSGVQLKGFKVFDSGRANVYRFPRLYLYPGDTIRLRTGRGSGGAPVCEEGTPCPENAHYDLYWGLEEYVWDNQGDKGVIKNSESEVIDRCAYGAAATSPHLC